jgi:alpha-1,3-rhamnosyltransferase
MNNSPLISALIPTYNHEKYIQETINSIINQTYQNIELIIIDDGSTDSTWQKMQEMEELCKKRFKRVVFKTKENEGLCLTLNKLLDEAQGEYIYLIASDDLAKPQAIEKQLLYIIKNNAVVVVGDNEIIDNDGNRIGWDKKRNNCKLKNALYKTFGDFLKIKEKIQVFGTYDQLLKGNHIPNGYLIKNGS